MLFAQIEIQIDLSRHFVQLWMWLDMQKLTEFFKLVADEGNRIFGVHHQCTQSLVPSNLDKVLKQAVCGNTHLYNIYFEIASKLTYTWSQFSWHREHNKTYLDSDWCIS